MIDSLGSCLHFVAHVHDEGFILKEIGTLYTLGARGFSCAVSGSGVLYRGFAARGVRLRSTRSADADATGYKQTSGTQGTPHSSRKGKKTLWHHYRYKDSPQIA